jgi:TolA-binding protein
VPQNPVDLVRFGMLGMVCTSRFRGERTRGLSKADSLRRRMSGLDTRAAFRRLALQQQEEKIRDMEDRIARLQKELEESSRQIASLQAGSDETTRARRSVQRNVNNSRREETRLADQNPSPEPRFYQTVRSTSVFEGFCGERNHASSPCSWRYTHSPSVSGLLFSSHALNIGDS